MRIEAGLTGNIQFKDLACGDCFEVNDKAYMKCAAVYGSAEFTLKAVGYNAVNLKYGRFHCFEDNQVVQSRPNAEVILEAPRCR
jgi:hypothetical protein